MMLIAQISSLTEPVSFGWLFARTIVAMIVVIVLAIWGLKYILPKILQAKRRAGSKIEVLDYQPLEARKSVYIIKIEDKKVAIGVSEHNVNKICDL
jgi:flagellar biosynthetic protein FliO